VICKSHHTQTVCIITTAHSAFATRIFYRQAKTLVRAGYDVTLIAQHDGDTMVEGVRIIGLPKPKNRFTRIFGLTWRAFRLALRQKADVYHFHDPELLPWGWLLQKITHKPVIYDVHEYYADCIITKEWIPAFFRGPISKVVDKQEKMLAKRLAGVITVNRDMEDLFKKANKNVITLHNYPSRSFVEKFNGKSLTDSFTVIYVGGVSRDRGYQVMVDAMQIVKDKEPRARCIIVGPIDEAGLSKAFLGRQASLLETGGVELTGEVSYQEIPRLLSKASIGWYPVLPTPNYLQATPIKIFEYMAARMPIVCSNMGFVKGIVEQAECGLLAEAGNPEAHAVALLHLLENPGEAQKLGENGHQAVLEEYNWEKEVKKLEEFYRIALS
jgi:glycosyltransferase involved in cell wall biosynthesis